MPLVKTTRLNTVINNATGVLASLGSKYEEQKRKGNPCSCEYNKAQFLYMALVVLNDWQQNASGSDAGKDNYITQEQLSDLVSVVETAIHLPSNVSYTSTGTISFLGDLID